MRAKQSNGRGLEGFGMNMAAFDYGCHCNALITGKQFGIGKPVDPLDSVCKPGTVSYLFKIKESLSGHIKNQPIIYITNQPRTTRLSSTE